MNIEHGPERMLPKRELVSLIKEHDDVVAENGIAGGAEEQSQSLHKKINNLREQLDAERMNYTDEQWALLSQIANFESGYSGFAESTIVGNVDEEYKKERQGQIDTEKERLQKRWKDIFGDEVFEW